MWLLKFQARWLESHAESGEDGKWRCKKTGTTIMSDWVKAGEGAQALIGLKSLSMITILRCPGCSADDLASLLDAAKSASSDDLERWE